MDNFAPRIAAILEYLRGNRKTFVRILVVLLIFSYVPMLMPAGFAYKLSNDYAADLELDGTSSANPATVPVIETVRSAIALLRTMHHASKLVDSIYYLDHAGRFIVSSDQYAMPVDEFHDTEWMSALEPSGAPSPLGYVASGPRLVAYPSTRKFASRERELVSMILATGGFISYFSGHFVVNIDVERLSRWPANRETEAAGTLSVVNTEGNRVFGTEIDPRIWRRLSARRRAGPLVDGSVYYTHQTVGGWMMVMQVPAREYFSFARRLTAALAVILIPLFVAAVVGAAIASDRIYAPIQRLVDVMEERLGPVPDSTDELLYVGGALETILGEAQGLRRLLARSRPAVKESLVRSALAGETAARSEVADELARTGYPLPYSLYAAAVIVPSPMDRQSGVSNSTTGHSVMVKTYESTHTPAAAVCGTSLAVDRIALIVNAVDRESASRLLTAASRRLKLELAVEAFAMVGGFVGSIDEIAESYAEAVVALETWVPRGDSPCVFVDYNVFAGLLRSEWGRIGELPAGVWDGRVIHRASQHRTLNFLSVLIAFPAPIALALLLNEVKPAFKRLVQGVMYVPHFLSWVVVSGLIVTILSPSTGRVDRVIRAPGGEPICFMTERAWWIAVYQLSGVWKDAGWGTIIFLAALSSWKTQW